MGHNAASLPVGNGATYSEVKHPDRQVEKPWADSTESQQDSSSSRQYRDGARQQIRPTVPRLSKTAAPADSTETEQDSSSDRPAVQLNTVI